MVVAQLVEQSLLATEVGGSKLVIDKKLYRTFTVNCTEKREIKKKEPVNCPFKKKY